MAKPESNTAKHFKRLLDQTYEQPGVDTPPLKKPRLNSAEAPADMNALSNMNHLQQHKPSSAKNQADANALSGKDQELRREDHSPTPVPKQDAAQPSEQKPLQPEAAENPAKKGRPPTGRTQLTKTQSALKLLQTAHDGIKQELKVLKEQQDESIKKRVEIALEIALDTEFVEAVDQAAAVLNVDVAKAVKKDVDADLKIMRAETEKLAKKTANDLQELRTELKNSETAREESDKKHGESIARVQAEHKAAIAEANDKHEAAIADVKNNHEAAMAKVKEAADEAEKEADKKLQKVVEEKKAAESTIVSMKKDFNRHSQQLVKRQQIQLEFIRHRHDAQEKRKRAQRGLILSSDHHESSATSTPDLMDLDEMAYPSPQSEVAQQTPNSWSQTQNSTNHFTNSTSSTTNDVSTHDFKPRQGLMWSSNRNATPFANSTPSKVSDPENIAMENHSRKGLSGEPSCGGDSDEEFPKSNAPSSQFHQYPAQQAAGSFGRPSFGHAAHLDGQQQQLSRYTPGPSSVSHVHHERVANIFTGAGQSNSRRGPRNTAVQNNYSQERGDDLNGILQSDSRRAAPPSHTQNAPAQWCQAPHGGNMMSNFYDTPRPTPQNTHPRAPKRRNRFNGTQYPDSGYAASQPRNPGKFAQAGPAHFDGDAQSHYSRRVPQSHYQDGHEYAPSGYLNGPAQSSSTYPGSQLHYQDSFTQAAPAPLSGHAQQMDFYAQQRRAAENQRTAAHHNLSSPAQGQPQQGQRGRGRGGRGGSRSARGGSRNSLGGSRNGRGGFMNGRGGSRNDHTMNRNQAYDADDEHDRRPVKDTTRQHGAKGAPTPQRNPFARQGGIPSIDQSFDEIIHTG